MPYLTLTITHTGVTAIQTQFAQGDTESPLPQLLGHSSSHEADYTRQQNTSPPSA